ncbi:MAG: hypothetical protein LUI07_04875 [Lachnospiraceae bacterium]|nr:hypothetical protein [Lachnospiraceae bacterium]
MKRCTICGNIGSEDDTVCKVCGNPLSETEGKPGNGEASAGSGEPELTVISENAGAEDAAAQDAEASAEKSTVRKAEKPVKEPNAAQRTARPRRTRSGPQIYGQDSMAGYDGAQGVIRRDVHGGHSSDAGQAGEGTSREVGGGARRQRHTSQGAQQYADMRQTIQGQRTNTQQTDAQGNRSGARQTVANGSGANEQQTISRGRGSGEQQLNVQGYRPEAQHLEARGQRPNGQQMNRQGQRSGMQPTAMGGIPPYAQASQENRASVPNAGISGRIIEAARGALRSPMFIFVALFYTLYLFSSVAAIFLRELNYAQIARLLTLVDLPSQLNGYVSMFQGAMAQLDSGALVLNLIIRVPDFLFCLGLWLVCISARRSEGQMPGAGFLLMKLVVVLNMIMACLILLVVLVLSVTLVIASWRAGTQGLLVVSVITLALAIGVTMAIIMYYFCYLGTINSIQKNVRMGELYGKASAYVAVLNMILSLTGIVSILSGIVNMEVTGITTGVGRIGGMFLLGVWILRYRSTLSEYNE